MDEDIAIVNQNTRVSLVKDFLKKNSKKIIISLSIILIMLLIFFVFEELKERKKEKLAQLYNGIIFNTDQYDQNDIKNEMIKIVNEKVDTYSALALYYLIDNKLVDDQTKISELFDQVISISDDKELKNLVIQRNRIKINFSTLSKFII